MRAVRPALSSRQVVRASPEPVVTAGLLRRPHALRRPECPESPIAKKKLGPPTAMRFTRRKKIAHNKDSKIIFRLSVAKAYFAPNQRDPLANMRFLDSQQVCSFQ